MTRQTGQKKAIPAGAATTVLVGTFRPKNADWIKERKFYNLPLPESVKFAATEFHRKISRIVLMAEGFPTVAYAAKFREVVGGEWLAANGYGRAVRSHAAAYALYELGAKVSYATVLSDPAADVFVSSSRCPSVRIDAEFYSKPYPKTGGKSMPYIFDKLKPYFKKWHSAVVFNPVQGDFFSILDDVENKMAKFKKTSQDENTLRFIDLFAGIGGIRKGFEMACSDYGIKTECVFTSEIKPHAIEVLRQNNPDDHIHGDITKIEARDIPDFDILLGGFPCQAFSAAGKRLGFEDTRGTLFFDVARIIREKQPKGFVLENVEGLVNHDKRDSHAPMGNTLSVILETLDGLGYKVSWRVLNASDFGIPQDRKRIYIVGAKTVEPNLSAFPKCNSSVGEIIEHGLPPQKSKFIDKLLSHYPVEALQGKAIKDKRGGNNNIHSWDFELKGKVSPKQRTLLNALLKERRKHQWADQYGIQWMDGMPLTLDMIRTFFDDPYLEKMLDDLAEKRYVVKEHPKRKIRRGNVFVREQDPNLPLGYNIVAGKMSFEISKILAMDEIAPTLVAMDMQHLFVVDGNGVRNLSLREGLRLFGYPENFKFDIPKDLGYDLLGNTVVVPVVKAVTGRLLDVLTKGKTK